MFQFIADWRRGRAERKQQELASRISWFPSSFGMAGRYGAVYTQEEANTSIWLVSWGDAMAHMLSTADRPWFDFRLRTEDVYFDRVPVPQRFYDSMCDEYGERHVSRFYEVQAPEDPILFECPHCYMGVRESDLLENDDDQD